MYPSCKILRWCAHTEPIRSRKGITIGSYCILDDVPREGVDLFTLQFMKDMAATVMNHLGLSRLKDRHRRGERMIAGLGSFLDSKATLGGSWHESPSQELEPGSPEEMSEGQLNAQQQEKQMVDDAARGGANEYRNTMNRPIPRIAGTSTGFTLTKTLGKRHAENLQRRLSVTPFGSRVKEASSQHTPMPCTTSNEHAESDTLPLRIQQTFSRAANVIRESIEV